VGLPDLLQSCQWLCAKISPHSLRTASSVPPTTSSILCTASCIVMMHACSSHFLESIVPFYTCRNNAFHLSASRSLWKCDLCESQKPL
jgi:hypothetical protein